MRSAAPSWPASRCTRTSSSTLRSWAVLARSADEAAKGRQRGGRRRERLSSRSSRTSRTMKPTPMAGQQINLISVSLAPGPTQSAPTTIITVLTATAILGFLRSMHISYLTITSIATAIAIVRPPKKPICIAALSLRWAFQRRAVPYTPPANPPIRIPAPIEVASISPAEVTGPAPPIHAAVSTAAERNVGTSVTTAMPRT
jgi:hypothetical protein